MMKRRPLIIIALVATLVMSCAILNNLIPGDQLSETSAPNPESPEAPDDQPTPPAEITETAVVTAPAVDQTADSNQKTRFLYFLADHGVWRSEGGLAEPVRITPAENQVTAFDVWPDDGRLAFALSDGRLFFILPGGQPELLLQIGTHPVYLAYIGDLDWSPKGESLAYVVHLDSQGQGVYTDFPTPPTGLWTVNIHDRNPVWLKSSHYLSYSQGNIKQIRVLGRPRWSPDGMAIMLTDGYYEWANIDWISPVQYTADDSNFHPMPKTQEGNLQAYMFGSWLPDGRSLVASGEMYSQFGSLVWVDRETGESKPLIDGQMAGLYILDAYPVPESVYLPGTLAGIHSGPNRFVYLANCANCGEGNPARLYVAAFVDGNLQGQAVGPEKMCNRKDSYGNANDARKIEWSPDFSRGVLICGPNEMYLLEMNTESFTLVDLMPNLPPLPENEVPIFTWGE